MKSLPALLLFALIASCNPASATTIAPGDYSLFLTQLPDGTPLGTVLAGATTDVPVSGALYQLQQAVYRDPSGTLTFTYRVGPGMPPNAGVWITGYQGVTVDAYYETAGGNFLIPGDAGRSADGDQLNFGFALGSPGTSALYVLKTNATAFDASGTTSFVLGSDIAGVEPVILSSTGVLVPAAIGAVPEPSSLAALGAVAGFAVLCRRHSRR